jgi:hypothetical protein
MTEEEEFAEAPAETEVAKGDSSGEGERKEESGGAE